MSLKLQGTCTIVLILLCFLQGAELSCNFTLGELFIPEGQHCMKSVWGFRDDETESCFLRFDGKGLVFNSQTKQWEEPEKTCFGNDAKKADCLYGNSQEFPDCGKNALELLRPEYCSIGKESDECAKKGERRDVLFVIDTKLRKHWVRHINIQFEESAKSTQLYQRVKPNCKDLTKAFCSSKDVILVNKNASCTDLTADQACIGNFFLGRPEQKVIWVGNCRVPILCHGYENVMTYNGLYVQPEVSLKDEDMIVMCKGDEITVETFSNTPNIVRACSLHQCLISDIVGKSAVLKRPLSEVVEETHYTIHLLYNGGVLNTKTLLCQSRELCSSITCTFCLEWLFNPRCWSAYHWSAVLFLLYLILSILATLIVLLKPLGSIVKFLLHLLMRITRVLIGCCRHHGKKSLTRARTTINDLESGYTLGESHPFIPESKANIYEKKSKVIPYAIRSERPFRYSQLSNLVVLLVLMITQCSSAEFLSREQQIQTVGHEIDYDCHQLTTTLSKFSDCRIGMDYDQCPGKVLATVDLPVKPQLACLSILKGTKELPMGTLTLRIKEASLKCNKKVLYYTRDYRWSHVGERRCNSAGWCTEESCAQVKPQSVLEFMNSTKNITMGRSYCQSAPGGEANGCFWHTDGCLAWRWFGQPKNDLVYEVFECPTWDPYVQVAMRLLDDAGKDLAILDLSDQVITSWKGLLVEPSLTLSTSLPILSKRFIRVVEPLDQNVYFAEAQDAGQQVSGRLGQVQCQTIKQARAYENCKFASDICNCRNTIRSVSCDCKDVNPESFLTLDNKLPLFSSNFHLVSHKGEVKAEYPGVLKVKVKLSGLIDLRITHTDRSEKCLFKPKEIKGCYSCLRGATLRYTCMSSSTMVTVVHCNSYNISIICSDSDVTREAHFLSSLPNENLQCQAICEKDAPSKSIIASLDFHGFTQYANATRLIVGSDPPNLGFSFWKWFTNLFSFGWFKIAAYIGIGLAALFAIHLVTTTILVPVSSRFKRKLT